MWVFSKPRNKARLSGVPGMTSLLSGLRSCPHPTLTQGHRRGPCLTPSGCQHHVWTSWSLGKSLGGDVERKGRPRPESCKHLVQLWVFCMWTSVWPVVPPSVHLLLQSPRPVPWPVPGKSPCLHTCVALSLGSARRSSLILGGTGEGTGRRAVKSASSEGVGSSCEEDRVGGRCPGNCPPPPQRLALATVRPVCVRAREPSTW